MYVSKGIVLALLPFAIALAQETILGVYIFHRHGDRTPKTLPPANLTSLGYNQVYTSGQYYRTRYISADATARISGISPDVVKQSQISVSAPDDTVIQSSAVAFLQGLYPPVGSSASGQLLRNGTTVEAPLNGYQLIPIDLVQSGSGSEDNTWLQSSTGCANAVASSNNYFYSEEYVETLGTTRAFYQSLEPVVNATFNGSYMSFKNAYTIYDLIHVAEIHNQSIQSDNLVEAPTLHQLQTRADQHEFGLAYNSSDNIRGIAGMTLAGQILDFFNRSISGGGAQKINVEFGAYGTFLSFFGLASLMAADPNFYGITDYASSMAFELFVNSSAETTYPSSPDALNVRFLFHNGSASSSSTPVAYPLFGTTARVTSYSKFVSNMEKFAVRNTQQWCAACGNSTGTCAAGARPSSPPSSSASAVDSNQPSSGMSLAVAWVIGAMVTLAVVLGAEALALLLGGLKVVSKKRLAHADATLAEESVGAKA